MLKTISLAKSPFRSDKADAATAKERLVPTTATKMFDDVTTAADVTAHSTV
jgi:hypothetical protein